ncbi:MAG: FapA family protein, partial [Planctomycetes bacterium]|nr:FapA family protein [Planctomycetota bacterium]
MSGQDETDKGDVVLSGYKGDPVPMRTLYYDQNPEREMHIVCSPDRMRVYMKVVPGTQFAGISRETIIGHIFSAGVTYGLIDAGVNLFAAMQSGPSPFTGYYQVARGDPMRQGEDGSIEFHVQPTSIAPRYDEDESGSIDYKQLNLVENCFAGQRVASLRPPGPGRA